MTNLVLWFVPHSSLRGHAVAAAIQEQPQGVGGVQNGQRNILE
ncbi:MAG: hypothetical protein WCG04_06530 [Alphaproteobacteria bacterium]